MQASQDAMRQIQLKAALSRQRDAVATQQQQTADQARNANVAAARLAGGVYGYIRGAALSANEMAFYQAIIGLGINSDTADEVFRQGLSEIDTMSQLTTEKLKNIIYNVSRNKSLSARTKPRCFLVLHLKTRCL